MIASEPLHHFVDDYLSALYETNPTAATFDGVHLFDDLLEDFSRGAIESQIQTLAGLARRLASISTDSLTRVERIERPMIAAHIQGRIHDLEKVRTWERNPQMYGEIARREPRRPGAVRLRARSRSARAAVLSKLRQAPRFIQSARDNVKEPPGIFVKNGLETLRGTLRFIETDLPRAFADVDDLGLLGDLADAQTEAIDALKSYMGYLETDLAPKARASFRLGADRFAAKLGFEEGIDIPLDRLLDDRAARAEPRCRRSSARPPSRVEPATPSRCGGASRTGPRPPTASCSAAREQIERLATFIERRGPGVAARRRAGDGGADAGLLPLDRSPACGRRGRSRRGRRAPTTTSPTPTRRGRRTAGRSTCGISTRRRSGRSRCTRSTRATSCTSSTCATWSRRRASR